MEQIKHWVITNWKTTAFGVIVNLGGYFLVKYGVVPADVASYILVILNALGFAVSTDPTKPPVIPPKAG